MIDTTNKKIQNTGSTAAKKEDRWLEDFSDETLKIVSIGESNIYCKACDKYLQCSDVSRLKDHLKTKKHPPNVRRYMAAEKKLAQSQLPVQSALELQNSMLYGFMFSCFLSNFPGNAASKFADTFIMKIAKVRYAQKIPRQKHAFSKLIGACHRKMREWMQEEITMQSDKNGEGTYAIQVDEGNDIMEAGCYAPLIQFSNSTRKKPICMTVQFSMCNANNSIVGGMVNTWREQYHLNYQKLIFFLSDGTRYNVATFSKLIGYYPFIHHLISTLHMLANGVKYGIKKSSVMSKVREVLKRGPELFSKSVQRRTSWRAFVGELDSLAEDPFIHYLYETMAWTDFCELYDLDENDKNALDVVTDGDCNSEESAILKKMVCLRNIPPRNIENKWKCLLLCVFFWMHRLLDFRRWCQRKLSDELFFSKMSEDEAVCVRLQFSLLWNKLKCNITFILLVESRKFLGFRIHGDIRTLLQNYKNDGGVETLALKLPAHIQQQMKDIIDNERLDDLENDIPISAISFQVPTSVTLSEHYVVILESLWMEANDSFNVEVVKQFESALAKDTMAAFCDMYNLNPFNDALPAKSTVAFKFLKHGPNQYGNDPLQLSRIEKQYAFFRTVLAPFIRGEDVECKLDDEIVDELKQFKKPLENFDVVKFWSCKTLKQFCPWLSKFARETLFFAVDDVDSERVMSFLAMLAKNKLLASLGYENKAVRIWSLWEREVVLRNIT